MRVQYVAVLLVLFVVAYSAPKNTDSTKFAHKSVVDLNEKNFDEAVGDGKTYFIKFYAPWCGHCKQLAPTWGKLGEALASQPGIKIAHVDCTNNKDLCTKVGVKGYPTLKVFANGEEYKAYQGSREIGALKSYIVDVHKELTEVAEE
eukprot:TRINITY_DN49424_c0_g2_i1.p2 TRINITY_DN49424_c0_g2~~TRINITY_DN49424_c0_g2_i1.p2  ORF type:complete len:147 (-),score=23.21 TRINITY_DN49424_c0_g2_i1:215-655(-)